MLLSEYKREWLKVTKNITEISRDEPRVCVAYRFVCDVSCDMRKCVMKIKTSKKGEIKASSWDGKLQLMKWLQLCTIVAVSLILWQGVWHVTPNVRKMRKYRPREELGSSASPQLLKWFGYGHLYNEQEEEQHSCAQLCPPCPQPGINLPVDWEAVGTSTKGKEICLFYITVSPLTKY